MILFYYTFSAYNLKSSDLFQFHYDLILLREYEEKIDNYVLFQFHYDLILFTKLDRPDVLAGKFQFHYDLILLNYGLPAFAVTIRFQFHYDLILLSTNQDYFIGISNNFNFIMILFY